MNITSRYILLISCIFLLPGFLLSQQKTRYNVAAYNVNEGLLQSNVLDIAFDENNFCWLSFYNGIQKFDGNSFTDIPVQSGLPDDKAVSFFRQRNGNLLLIHNKGISRYNIQKDIFELIYNKASSPKPLINILGEYNNHIYLINEKGVVNVLNENTFKQTDSFLLNLPAHTTSEKDKLVHSKIVQGKFVFFIGDKLYLASLKEKKVIATSIPLSFVSPYFIGLDDNGQATFFTGNVNYELVSYDFKRNEISTVCTNKLMYAKSFRGQQLKWNNKNLMVFYNHLFVMSDDYKTTTSELVDFKNNTLAGNSSIAKTATDNFGNLFLVTINDGIKKIIGNSYPIKYFGTTQKEGNYIVSIYANKAGNNILAGTYGNGLLLFDTLQNLIKHIQHLPGEKQSFSVNAITKNVAGDYIFFVHSKPEAFLLSKDLSAIKKLPIKREEDYTTQQTGYCGSLVAETPNSALLQAGGSIYKVNKLNNSIQQKAISPYVTYGSLLYVNYLISHANETLSFFDSTHFKLIKSIPFPNTGGVRCYATDGKNIYLGSNKGIFVTDINGRIVKQFNKANGLPDDCIYAMAFDAGNNIWCSTNKGIVKISSKGNILQLTKNDGLQENEFNTNVVFKTAENELFFGGINGVNSFFSNNIPDYMVDVKIYLTHIKINNKDIVRDTASWNIAQLILPYNENSLALDFIASGQKNAAQYVHQYKMEGVDKEWMQNTGIQPVRYMLSPGKYVFKMYASSYFEKDAVALKELIIIIKPPFWKTWWFISLLGLAFILLIIYFVNLYNKISYGKKMAVLKTHQKVQEERERMSMELHDSIGAYANAVLYNTELLQAEEDETDRKEIMKDLRFASKDIITSLRETIWALKNENYSAQECLLRIRNFIHPFTRYYPGIHFKVEGTASDQKELHYALALNIVRIVQESVNNAIKHSNAANIIIKSMEDGNNWTLVITDDGKGFNEAITEYGNGIGNMKRRAKEMGFVVDIISRENEGTQITISVT